MYAPNFANWDSVPPNLLATKVKSQVNDTLKNQMCKFFFHMHFTMILKVVHRYVKSLETDWLFIPIFYVLIWNKNFYLNCVSPICMAL